MKKLLLSVSFFALISCSPASNDDQDSDTTNITEQKSSSIISKIDSWKAQAKNITIIRDKWGIPHIYGKTDADAVFGLMYAQSQDDFNRVEVNYLNAMGRLAEAEGEKAIFRDLRMKLFVTPKNLKKRYAGSPKYLKKLMVAYADGLNYFLYMNPQIKPKVITHFEPWMALSFSEGSIGGDIESVSIRNLKKFYGNAPERQHASLSPKLIKDPDLEPRGSNGFAIAPSNTKNGKALLYINPHTTFFFREEAHMVSEEGLNAYGALTWGQFFIYQGFNENAGWMHTSSYADVIDEFLETITEKDGKFFYKYGNEQRELTQSKIDIPYKTKDGLKKKTMSVFHSHHGPIIREENGKWVAVKMMFKPVKALAQSFLRTKAQNYKQYHKMMEYKANSSNNTIFADSEGNIAYFHGNFHPIRNVKYDYTKPVDGSNPDTDWKGLHDVDEAINVVNPKNGWIQNTNNWPFSVTGKHSPKKADFPIYMSSTTENPRGRHAIEMLDNVTDFTIDSLIKAGYDSYMPAFDKLIPALVKSFKKSNDLKKSNLKEAVKFLKSWDYRYGLKSKETTLAVFWATDLLTKMRKDKALRALSGINNRNYIDVMSEDMAGQLQLESLRAAMNLMMKDFGTWKVEFGKVNRYQRITGDIKQKFSDDKPSLPVGYASARWGALASFGARRYSRTKSFYGTSGNSFIASVQFGDKLKAKALTAGGINSNPDNKHFDDQAKIFTKGIFRDVLFYKEDILKNMESRYHPGEEKKTP